MKKQLVNFIDLQEAARREDGELLYTGACGSIVREPRDGTILSDILDGSALCRLVRELKIPNLWQFSVKSAAVAEKVSAEFGLKEQMRCTQAVYCKDQPPVRLHCDIRALTDQHSALAAAHYHLVDDSEQYIRERIAAGRMWGLFENGVLAGFIGMHTEGSMGMLEVFPEHRRKGYGYQLEAFLIAWHLERGWIPYCHIIDGNNASMRLQEKLGLTFAELPAIWVN